MILLTDLNKVPKADFIAALANVFEHSPWISEQVFHARPYNDVPELFAAMVDAVNSASPQDRLALLNAQLDIPRSAGEPNSLELNNVSKIEQDRFKQANSAYQTKFGFPYIVCVPRHTRDFLLQDLERRLQNDPASEIKISVKEICRIAALRLDHLIAGSGLKVHGHLSTHVLDTHSGKPAPGILVELRELSAFGESRTIARTLTNSDGRTDEPLIHGRPLPIGNYELNFQVAAYFTKLGVPMSDPPFLDIIPIRFSISEPESRLHVPLLVTPWSFTTYRGS